MLVLIMATIINTVLMTLQALFEFLTEDCHLLAASMLQVPRPMDVPFNPSTSCQGATHVFVVFLLHHGLTVGPPPSSADSAWFLTQDSGFAGHDDGRRNRAPPLKPPWFFEQETATGNRNPISVFLRAKKVAVSKKACHPL
jgi:hypothetical protein